MIRLFIILTLVISFWGCTATNDSVLIKKEDIMNAYLSDVSKKDGIDKREAMLLAQSEVVFRGQDQAYHIEQPILDFQDEDHWGIKFYPINRTLAQAKSSTPILIVIKKENGQASWYYDSQ